MKQTTDPLVQKRSAPRTATNHASPNWDRPCFWLFGIIKRTFEEFNVARTRGEGEFYDLY